MKKYKNKIIDAGIVLIFICFSIGMVLPNNRILNNCERLKSRVEAEWHGDDDYKVVSKEIEFEEISYNFYKPISKLGGADLHEVYFNLATCFPEQFIEEEFVGKGTVNHPFIMQDNVGLTVRTKVLTHDFLQRSDIDSYYLEYKFKGKSLIIRLPEEPPIINNFLGGIMMGGFFSFPLFLLKDRGD
jgi:hypothetical protein